MPTAAKPTKGDIYRSYCVLFVGTNSTDFIMQTGPEGTRRLRLPDFKTIGT